MDPEKKNNDSETGVKFKEDRLPPLAPFEPPKIIQWVIKYSGGLVKDERQASYAILGLFGLSLVIAIILFLNAFSGPSKPPAGYRGNIPDLPEYRNPPTPQDFR